LGFSLTKELYKKYGMSNVISSDIQDHFDVPNKLEGKFVKLDVTDKKSFNDIIASYQINKIIHLANIPPLDCEKDTEVATKVNIEGVHNALDISREHKISIFIPSSMEIYNGIIYDENSPVNPQNLYGITKLYMEKLGLYYFEKFGVDFRCLRYPIILSNSDEFGSFPYDAINSAIKGQTYNITNDLNMKLPFLHFSDCVRSTFQFIDSHHSLLKRRIYNIGGMSFTCASYIKELKKAIKFNATCEIDPIKNNYLKNFPAEVSDRNAREDWGWQPEITKPKKLVENILMSMF